MSGSEESGDEVDLFASDDDDAYQINGDYDDFVVTPAKDLVQSRPTLSLGEPQVMRQRLEDAYAAEIQNIAALKPVEPPKLDPSLVEKVAASISKTPILPATKILAVHRVLNLKMSKCSVVKWLETECGLTVQHKQINDWVKNIQAIYTAWTENKVRRSGGGTKRLGVFLNTEAATLSWYNKRHADGQRTRFLDVRRQLGTPNHPVSAFTACTFMRAHDLRLRAATLKTVITPSEIESLTQSFLNNSSHINKLFGGLQAHQIVQFDEVATSLNGFMKDKATYIESGSCGTTFVETCDLDSDKKFCTGVHFLCPIEIPPLLIFKGADGPCVTLVGSNSPHRCLTWNSKHACMTTQIMCEVVIPHIKLFNPQAKVLVFDRATSHTTAAVDEALTRHDLCSLIIPGKCASVLQALDVYFFSQYRHMHNRLISEVVSQRGCYAFTALSAAEKRDIASITVAEAAHIVRRDMDVSAIFKKLGYMSPSTESVCLRNLPSFVFRPPLKADFDAYLAYLNGTVLQKVDEDYASAVANISSVAISPKIGPRKRGRPRKEDALATAVARSRKSSGPLDKFLQPRESLASRPQTQACEEKQSQPYEILSGKIDAARRKGTLVCGEVLDVMCEGLCRMRLATKCISVASKKPHAPSEDTIVRPIHYRNHYALCVYKPGDCAVDVYDSASTYYRIERDALALSLCENITKVNEIVCMQQQPGENDCAFWVVRNLASFLQQDLPSARADLCDFAQREVDVMSQLLEDVLLF